MNLKKVREGILLGGAVAAILALILGSVAYFSNVVWRGDQNVKEIQESEIGALRSVMEAGFESIDTQFDTIYRVVETGFEAVYQRFESVDQRFESIEGEMRSGFEAVDQRFEAVEGEMRSGFEAVDQRFDSVDLRFETFDREMRSGFEAIDSVMRAKFETAEAQRAAIMKEVAGLIRAVERNAQVSRDGDQKLENLIDDERERIEREIQLYRRITKELEQRIEALEAKLN